MTTPQRIRQSRQAGWRKPAGAVVVSRPSRWGNFYKVSRNTALATSGPRRGWVRCGPELVVIKVHPRGRRHMGYSEGFAGFTDKVDATRFAVDLYRRALLASWAEPNGHLYRDDYLGPLVGHDLVCWCPLFTPGGEPWPCHARVLLEFANDPTWLATRSAA